MKKFIVGGTIFYMLSPGERVQSNDIDYDCTRHYIIWSVDDSWHIKYKFSQGWENITEQNFETENAAFNFAYEHFQKTQKIWPPR
ncbi:hypothetical protein [Leclercia sp. Marseille-Q4284]|uniref:hypothetical protein n=1 Tax=Leclercia sp. Marseille-Q4284 TaxID=2866582 RepID=UPI001CE3F700|nr:hypothetical protein [Leclercia sp. Marseille-Q4284]